MLVQVHLTTHLQVTLKPTKRGGENKIAKLNVESWEQHMSFCTLCISLDSLQIILWQEQERLSGVALSSSLHVGAIAGLVPPKFYSLVLIHQVDEQFVQLPPTLSCSGLPENG